ncbi:phage portal protein [Streptomyces sp. NPDC093249]|uniref:phage portal protein n=1 Tax=unclassified Streptomyces TaxID=2593676 RepID=UPI00380785E8
MPREFLPGLRRLLTRPVEVEEKSAMAVGAPHMSMSYAGTTTVWGTENRAAGWDLDRVVQEGYERSIWTFKAVDAISKHPGAMQVEIGRGRGGDDGQFAETLTDHPLLRVLNVRANPLETAAVFKKRLSAQVLLSKKGAFVEITRSRAGTITRLDLLPPDRVEPISDLRGDYLSHYQFTAADGRVRELDLSRVAWLRDPHPTDPLCGVTPLEAAGLSVSLDVQARLYNISFIANDARPSGIVAIDVDGLDQREIDRIQHRLAPGAQQAGETVVVGSGPGGLNYVDTSTRPRDMNYAELAKAAKTEILSAFGVPESIVGNAAERTYANADREEWTYWEHTQMPHLGLIAAAFDFDLDDGWSIRFDTSRVEALEFPRRQRRAEAREEWNAGLITADEYRKVAGREPFDVAHSRALWISPQKAPVPANQEDAVALGVAQNPAAGGAAGLPEGESPTAPVPAGDTSAAAAVDDASGGAMSPAASDVAAATAMPGSPPGDGSAAAVVAAAREQRPESPSGDAVQNVEAARSAGAVAAIPGDAARDVEAAQGPLEGKSLDGGVEVADADLDAAVSAVTAVLAALLARQEGVVRARLRSPKIRKGTRYWAPDGATDLRRGTAPIDGHRVVGAERWEDEVSSTLAPVLQQTAAATARKLAAHLTGTDSVPPGAAAAALTAATVAGRAVLAFLTDLADALNEAQADQTTLTDLDEVIGQFFADRTSAFIQQVAESSAVSTVNGAGDAAAEDIGPSVLRTWVTRRDTHVRPEHRQLDGTTLPAGTPFEVDNVTLRYPGDPFAPAGLTSNCRCRLRYRTGTAQDGVSPP